MILLIAIFLVIFESTYEGLALKGHKTIAGVIEGIYRAVITLIVFAWLTGFLNRPQEHNFYFTLGGYLLLRFALFDMVFNLFAGLPIFFIGTTKLFDKLFRAMKMSQGFLAFTRICCLAVGLTWLIIK